ncbi:hypothetical protein EDD85DRAFT_956454 [Armillaria nabsnona]|nr:hypothetical protein EDD85DRAFT_956454 [Armillaria nabsnona]
MDNRKVQHRGRPRKHETEEEWRVARASTQARYYERNRLEINDGMRHRYHSKKPPHIKSRRCRPREQDSEHTVPSSSKGSQAISSKAAVCVRLLRGIKLCCGQLMALTGNNSTKYIGCLCSDYLGAKEENIATLEEALSNIVKIYDNANRDLQRIYGVWSVTNISRRGGTCQQACRY